MPDEPQKPQTLKRAPLKTGVSLSYKTWGRADNALPLVLLHGWAGSMQDWRLLEPLIARDYYCLSYDAAGFGSSQFNSGEPTAKTDFSIERYVEDLKALLDQENLEKVHLVGHSWGGVIAMAFAARYPERVVSLVAIGSAYFDPENRLHIALKWASYLIGQLILLLKGPLKKWKGLRRVAARRYFYRPPDPLETEELMQEVLASDPQALIQTLLSGYEVRFKTVCPAIACPTLYLGCNRDVVAPTAYVEAFVPLTPGSSYHQMQDCGHFPMIEKPLELYEVLRNFWESHKGEN
ncbi:MAG TPA: alpha/beta hydrolase [Chloroflexia bacterium]|nr:alpha/beta hydrolase [Chloroflexia bacterium]